MSARWCRPRRSARCRSGSGLADAALRAIIPASIAVTAQAEGRRIVEQAEDTAGGIRQGADDYASQILDALEQEVTKALAGIRKGIEVLDDRRADLQVVSP